MTTEASVSAAAGWQNTGVPGEFTSMGLLALSGMPVVDAMLRVRLKPTVAILPASRECLLRRVRESASHLIIDLSTTGLDRQLHVHHSLEAAINGIASAR